MRTWVTIWVDLSGLLIVSQAPCFERLSFDPLPFQQDGLAASEANVSRR